MSSLGRQVIRIGRMRSTPEAPMEPNVRRKVLIRNGVEVFGALLGVLLLLFMAGGCGERATPPQTSQSVPAKYQQGETAFHTHCARCHGQQALGTDQGPPLVHKIYEPSHHGDGAFYRAAANGVRAHHWNFGNMPKVEGVTKEEVGQIVQYVRWLQRQAGIF